MRLLRLPRDTTPGDWLTMQRSPAAWCANNQDCALQNLPNGPCAGQYVCGESVCNYQCGPAPEIAGKGDKPRSGG